MAEGNEKKGSSLDNECTETQRREEACPDVKCGFGIFQHICFHGCANIKCFSTFVILATGFNLALNIYINSQVTTIERYFGFSSTQIGLMLSFEDTGFLLTTLLISYRSQQLHIPRVLSIASLSFAVSALIYLSAYIASPGITTEAEESGITLAGINAGNNSTSDQSSLMRYSTKSTNLCRDGPLNRNCTSSWQRRMTGAPTEFTITALVILIVGMFIQGIGKSPRSPFIVAYIDDNIDKRKTSLYLGVIMGLIMIGPVISFASGSVVARIYVTLEDVDFNPADPRWIGAWWLGFPVYGAIILVVSVPLMCFPRRIKPRSLELIQKNKQRRSLTGFFRSMWVLLSNKFYMSMVLGQCFHIILVSGYLAFHAKYFEQQFGLPVFKANMIMAVMTIIAAVFGSIIGGYLTYKFKLASTGLLKFIVLMNFLLVIFTTTQIFIGCKNQYIVGYNSNRQNEIADNALNCSSSCFCEDVDFLPVCGSDGRNYFSPCHAGCETMGRRSFGNCRCLAGNGTATRGFCHPQCDHMLYVNVVVGTLIGFIVGISEMPIIMFSIRCVPEKEKALAVSFSTFLQTVLGWLPGPPLVGRLVDTSCLVWSTSCFGRGACALYDNEDFRYKRYGISAVVSLAILIMYVCLYLFAKRTDFEKLTSAADKDSSYSKQGPIT